MPRTAKNRRTKVLRFDLAKVLAWSGLFLSLLLLLSITLMRPS